MPPSKVLLDDLKDEYNAGDIITGKVICSVDKAYYIEAVTVNLEGAEHTYWLGHEQGAPVEYSGDNVFLELDKRWFGQGDPKSGDGDYEYPFELQLPKNLPGTYLSTHGWIKYTVKATLKSGYDLLVYRKEVNIVAPINLNEINDLNLKPVSYSEDKETSFLCCNNSISLNIYLEKEAFVLGEEVKVKAKIINKGSFEVYGSHAKIWMMLDWSFIRPRHKSIRKFELLATDFSNQPVFAGFDRSYSFNLKLSKSADVPNFSLCKLFSQTCILEVTSCFNVRCFDDIKIPINVVVGHIPIEEGQQNREVTLPAKDNTRSSATHLSALVEPKYYPPSSHTPTHYQPDLPKPPSPLPYPPDISQPANSNSVPYPPRPYLPPLDKPATKKSVLDEFKPMVSLSLGQPTPYPPMKSDRSYPAPYPPEDPKSPDSHPPQKHRAPYPTYEEPTTRQNVASSMGHTRTPYPPEEPKSHSQPMPYSSHVPYPPERVNSPSLSQGKPVPYLPNFPKLRHSYPFEKRTSHDKLPVRGASLDEIKPAVSLWPGAPAPYPPERSQPPYPTGDNLAPYPPQGRKFPDSHLPQTHRAPYPVAMPMPYQPKMPLPRGGSLDTYLLPPKNSSPYLLQKKTTPYLSYNEARAPSPNLSQGKPIPYLPGFPKKQSDVSDRHLPPYAAQDKPTEPSVSPTESEKSILLGIGKPTPYRSYRGSGSSVKYLPESFNMLYPSESSSPYPSAMPQPERSNPPYPTNDTLRTPYPPSSTTAPYPVAMPMPDHLYRSHNPPYPQDASKPPYSSGFKPSYSSPTHQLPYPLDEAKHPHPIKKKSQLPYPTSPPSGRNVAPYPVDVGPSASPIFSPLHKQLPPRCDSIGFAVPTSTTSSSESLHEAVPLVPMPRPTSTPYPTTHAPSAPLIEDRASSSELEEVDPTTPLLEGGAEITPPPTYEEAISSPITSPLKSTYI